MIQYIKNKDINKTKWDCCVANAVNPIVYAQSWYLDTVCGNQWDALIIGDYIAIMPLSYNVKMGIKYLYQPTFCQQLGIVSSEQLSADLIASFLQAIPASFKFIEINLNYGNNAQPFDNFNVEAKPNVELALGIDYEVLHANYSTNLKRNLKKINATEFNLKYNITAAAIFELFKNNNKNSDQILDKDYKLLDDIVNRGTLIQQIETAGVIDSATDKLLAGAIFLIDSRSVTFLFSGISDLGKERKAMFYLLDQMIIKYHNHKVKFDFEGSLDPDLARFYSGFGGEVVHYYHIKSNRLPIYLKWLKK